MLQRLPDSTKTDRGELPAVPWSWYYVGPVHRLKRGPLGVSIGSRQFVVYRTAQRELVALDGRCVHMGADLVQGAVEGNCLRCPFHGWAFDSAGRCVDIPAAHEIPDFARLQSYPTADLCGHVFLFNRPQPTFPLPFFDGVTPHELLPARPFEFETDLPWYLVGANGFDGQHFRAAHDRELLDEPVVTRPAPGAYRISSRFAVAGDTWRDRVTRSFSGRELRLTVTSYGGTLILVTAEFARTTSYGLVCVWPLGPERSRLLDIVWVRRRPGAWGRCFDPLDAALRRQFIRAFVRDDQRRSDGVRFNRDRLISADALLLGYLDWLRDVAVGEPF